MKVCKKCGGDKFKGNGRDCKQCAQERDRARYAANKEKILAANAKWMKNNPSKVRAYKAKWQANNVEKYKAITAIYRANNVQKEQERHKRYRELNLDKFMECDRRYRNANREKCRLLVQNRRAKKRANGGTLSSGLSEKLFKLQKGKCACCGMPLGKDFHMDHIMPIALGGENVDANIQLLRARCNIQKHAKHPVSFMQSRGFLL